MGRLMAGDLFQHFIQIADHNRGNRLEFSLNYAKLLLGMHGWFYSQAYECVASLWRKREEVFVCACVCVCVVVPFVFLRLSIVQLW